jgi:cyclase
VPAEWDEFYRGVVAEPSLAEVDEGVFAYIHHDGSWGLNNSGFVFSSDQLAVVDSALTEGRARAFRDAIETTAGLQPQLLINTHHHSDHTFGNSVFADACIVGHRLCRDAVLRQGLGPTGQDPVVPWGDIRVTPPQLLFDRELDVHVGDDLLQLIYVGPAHTDNDVVVWLPEKQVLFAGDVLFNHATPITHAGSTVGSVAALEAMKALGPRTIVPGHGAVCGPDVIDDWLRYFRFVSDVAARGAEAGLSPLEVAREQDLGEFAGWQHPERLVLNLHRAYAELPGSGGGVVDEPGAFADMLRLNPSSYGHRIIEDRERYVEPQPSQRAGD